MLFQYYLSLKNHFLVLHLKDLSTILYAVSSLLWYINVDLPCSHTLNIYLCYQICTSSKYWCRVEVLNDLHDFHLYSLPPAQDIFTLQSIIKTFDCDYLSQYFSLSQSILSNPEIINVSSFSLFHLIDIYIYMYIHTVQYFFL